LRALVREQANCLACVGNRKAQSCFCLSLEAKGKKNRRAGVAKNFRQEIYL